MNPTPQQLQQHQPPLAQSQSHTPTWHAVLVCDVVESVRWMQANEAHAVAQWQAFVERVKQEVLPKYSGRMVKSLGDGLMLEFSAQAASTAHRANITSTAYGASRSALQAAIALQSIAYELQGMPSQYAHETGASTLPKEKTTAQIPFQLRIGLHHTTATVGQDDIYGHGVNLCARIASLAGPGEIIISSDMRDQLTDQIDADIEDMGECYLKHIDEPVRVYRAGKMHSLRPSVLTSKEISLDSEHSLPSINQYEVNWELALAVLPFQNRGADARNQSLGDVLADSLINKLSKSQTLRVISRLSVGAVANRQLTLTELQRVLGVHYVVSGSFQNQGSNLIVMIELSDARTDAIVWTEQLREPIEDILDPDSALIGQAVREIHAHILRTESKRSALRPLPTIESYSLLLSSITMMHRMSKNDFAKSRSMLEHLIDRHPRSPIPLAWLARWHNLSIAQNWSDSPDKAVKYAQSLINKSLDFDPEHALALSIKGLLHGYVEKDFDKAAKSYDAAILSNPSEPLAWIGQSSLHVWQGRGVDATQTAHRALALTPLNPIRYYYESLTAAAMLSAEKYDEAIRFASQSLRSNAGMSSTYKVLSIAQQLNNRLVDSQVTVQKLLQLEPDFTVDKFMAMSPLYKPASGIRYAQALYDAGVPLN